MNEDMKIDEPAMQEIGYLIRTQGNRCTSDPIFIVQRRRRTYGVDTDFTDKTVWMDSDHEEATADEAARLDKLLRKNGEVANWKKYGFVEHWDFVTACFTEQGCKDYLAVDGHNLGETRIYVASGYRNAEWIAVRKFLAEG